MSSFKDDLLRDATDCCRELYRGTGERLRGQHHVSHADKEGVRRLLERHRRLELTDPFPGADDGIEPGDLRELALRLRSGELAVEEGTTTFYDWLDAHFPPPAAAAPQVAEQTTTVLTSPVNNRMLDGVQQFQTGITGARLRLRSAGDPFDPDAYRAARNAYTAAADAYRIILRDNYRETPLEDVVRFERDHVSRLKTVSGADFPATIDAATAFIDDRLFPLA